MPSSSSTPTSTRCAITRPTFRRSRRRWTRIAFRSRVASAARAAAARPTRRPRTGWACSRALRSAAPHRGCDSISARFPSRWARTEGGRRCRRRSPLPRTRSLRRSARLRRGHRVRGRPRHSGRPPGENSRVSGRLRHNDRIRGRLKGHHRDRLKGRLKDHRGHLRHHRGRRGATSAHAHHHDSDRRHHAPTRANAHGRRPGRRSAGADARRRRATSAPVESSENGRVGGRPPTRAASTRNVVLPSAADATPSGADEADHEADHEAGRAIDHRTSRETSRETDREATSGEKNGEKTGEMTGEMIDETTDAMIDEMTGGVAGPVDTLARQTIVMPLDAIVPADMIPLGGVSPTSFWSCFLAHPHVSVNKQPRITTQLPGRDGPSPTWHLPRRSGTRRWRRSGSTSTRGPCPR